MTVIFVRTKNVEAWLWSRLFIFAAESMHAGRAFGGGRAAKPAVASGYACLTVMGFRGYAGW